MLDVLDLVDRATEALATCCAIANAAPMARRFPPPWTVEETDACFIVKDHAGQSLAYVYFEDERAGDRRLLRGHGHAGHLSTGRFHAKGARLSKSAQCAAGHRLLARSWARKGQTEPPLNAPVGR